MLHKIFLVIGSALFLSGCSLSLPTGSGTSSGSVWKSFDNGQTFSSKVTIDEKTRISSADVLSFVFDPQNPNTIYIGTKENGIFKTADGAEHWERLTFPPLKVYGLAIDKNNSNRLYASGVYQDIAKIYRSEDAGKNWKEIYTEPGKGTVITALGSHPNMPNVLYAGTSAGVVIKSTNGGETWSNVLAAKGPVTKILFREGQAETVMLLVLNSGVAVSSDGGKTWNDFTTQDFSSADMANIQPDGIVTLLADPANSNSNILYAGAKNGLFRSEDNGKSWKELAIIESSKKFPVHAIAVNPQNSSEIVYAVGNAFYRSLDGGTKWATTQLEIDRGVGNIEYDPANPEIIYFTLRKF
jgi:photosystem II stability/assembly factor-like uncharacterized protein